MAAAEEATAVDVDALLKYVSKYGYKPADAKSWDVPPNADRAQGDGEVEAGTRVGTNIELDVIGHEEKDGHTWYNVECCLVLQGSRRLNWQAPRRLLQLREGLHDQLKNGMAEAYKKHFGHASFALKGGLPGTTARLKGWFAALAACINTGGCTPDLVGLTLEFLEAPAPPSLADNAKKKMLTMACRVKDKVQNTKDSVKQSVEKAQMEYAETATEAGMKFAKQNPDLAKKGAPIAAGLMKNNPQMAQSAGKVGAQASFKMMKENPKMGMKMMKMTAKTAARTM